MTETASMTIDVKSIPREGCTRQAAYDPLRMDMDRDDVRLREPFEVEAFVTVAERELVVNAQIRAPLSLTCARCLEEFPLVVTPRALLTYGVRPSDEVDITEDVRQEVILAYPMVPLCRPTCKGLCSVCGQNLNVTACDHQGPEPVSQ
jgi:uncharacterized protein